MFARLRHDALIGGDDEQGQVDAAHAGEHVFDEVAVAGHIDNADLLIAQRQPGEAEVDRHLARLFLGQAVGVNARQGAHQRRFPMIDMAGGADDMDGLVHWLAC